MKYYKKLNHGNAVIKQPWELGIIYPEDSHPDKTFTNTKSCIQMHPSRWEEVSLQDYAAQELAQNKLVKGGYYTVKETGVIFKYAQKWDAEYYIGKSGKTVDNFQRNGGAFTYENTAYCRIATQQEIDWLEECNKADMFIPKVQMKKLDLDNFAIVVEDNARTIVRYLQEIKLVVDMWIGGAINGSFYTIYKGNANCVTHTSSILKELVKYTLEEFKEAYKNIEKEQIIEKVKTFVLPERWVVRNPNNEKSKSLYNYFNSLKDKGIEAYYPYVGGTYFHFPPYEGKAVTASNIQKDHKEITFEQFEKYVLNKTTEKVEEKKIIGYKLVKPEYARAAVKIEGFNYTGYGNILDRVFCVTKHKDAIRAWELEEVLHLWFEPVYEEVLKAGDYIVFLKAFDGAPVGHITKIDNILKDDFGGAKGWIKYSPAIGNGGGFRYEGNGFYLNKDFRLATKEEIKSFNQIKVGDWVVVLPKDPFYDNSEKGAQKVSVVQEKSLPYILEFQDGHTNSYSKVRKATEAEIKIAKANLEGKVSIKGYKSELSKDSVKFGCQTYKKDFVLQLGSFLENSNLKIESQEEIMKVVKYFRKN